LTPIWTDGRFVEEKPRDERGFVFNGVLGFLEATLFFALEVAVAVANLFLDFEGDGSEAALFRLLGGAIANKRPKSTQARGAVRGCYGSRVCEGARMKHGTTRRMKQKWLRPTKVLFGK
jgi:hypothetical protein